MGSSTEPPPITPNLHMTEIKRQVDEEMERDEEWVKKCVREMESEIMRLMKR